MKGVNWIPDDAFPSRIERHRLATRLDQAVDANVNLLRVWGGGLFESDDFYDLADERGLLIWQDFLLACAAYSEEEPLRSEIEAEARENVARIGSHPALVVLNGNNENLWGHEAWGWKPRLEGRSWGAFYYHELFPAIANELAPHVGYTPGARSRRTTSTTPTTPSTARCTSGTSGTRRTIRTTATTGRDSYRSSDGRGRRRGRLSSPGFPTTRSHPSRPECSCTRKPRTATSN
ncbi:hypothetical protein GCM10025881_15490 [Pseudolysinimonas kribbensis]|uniref:Glycoside hydrolase family 2 catalytic domain-containing protein n=1 Tax=Pseudolysinimonas kribbensis TaxID=433641 RepID=A0ABQ6K277_9MICO|nr:hypothetical protein GCM10025881_15490 [Pseudolysinimonas kribbensis]